MKGSIQASSGSPTLGVDVRVGATWSCNCKINCFLVINPTCDENLACTFLRIDRPWNSHRKLFSVNQPLKSCDASGVWINHEACLALRMSVASVWQSYSGRPWIALARGAVGSKWCQHGRAHSKPHLNSLSTAASVIETARLSLVANGRTTARTRMLSWQGPSWWATPIAASPFAVHAMSATSRRWFKWTSTLARTLAL